MTETIRMPALFGAQAASWRGLIELAPLLGENWLLVGGQMVFLHQVERQAQDVRPTDDVDVVVDLRAEPKALQRIHETLVSAGFDQDRPGPDGVAHRFRRDDALLDVLAPANLGNRASLEIGAGRTIGAPGTTQAFRRSSIVGVEVDDIVASIRRPDIVGAILGKAAAVTKIASQSADKRQTHVNDFAALVNMLGPKDRSTADLTKSECKMLGKLQLEALPELTTRSLELLLQAG